MPIESLRINAVEHVKQVYDHLQVAGKVMVRSALIDGKAHTAKIIDEETRKRQEEDEVINQLTVRVADSAQLRQDKTLARIVARGIAWELEVSNDIPALTERVNNLRSLLIDVSLRSIGLTPAEVEELRPYLLAQASHEPVD